MYYWEAVFQNEYTGLFVVIRGIFKYYKANDAQEEYFELSRNDTWLRSKGITSSYNLVTASLMESAKC